MVEVQPRSVAVRMAALAGAALLLGACGGAPDRPSAEPTTSRLRTPAETCTLQVGYWAAELVKATTDQGYDYQEMGLTAPDYRLVLAITKEARQLRRHATEEQTLAFVARESARRCAGRKATTCTTGAGAGWPCG